MEKFVACVQESPILSLNLLSDVAKSSYQKEIKMEHRATMTAPQITACFLQHLCVLHGLDPRGFDLPYNKSLVASQLGIELETFSRVLPKLQEQGITVCGKRIVFDDFQAVDQHTCRHCSVIESCPVHKKLRQKA